MWLYVKLFFFSISVTSKINLKKLVLVVLHFQALCIDIKYAMNFYVEN